MDIEKRICKFIGELYIGQKEDNDNINKNMQIYKLEDELKKYEEQYKKQIKILDNIGTSTPEGLNIQKVAWNIYAKMRQIRSDIESLKS